MRVSTCLAGLFLSLAAGAATPSMAQQIDLGFMTLDADVLDPFPIRRLDLELSRGLGALRSFKFGDGLVAPIFDGGSDRKPKVGLEYSAPSGRRQSLSMFYDGPDENDAPSFGLDMQFRLDF